MASLPACPACLPACLPPHMHTHTHAPLPHMPPTAEKWSTSWPTRPAPPKSQASESRMTRYLPGSGTGICSSGSGGGGAKVMEQASSRHMPRQSRGGAAGSCQPARSPASPHAGRPWIPGPSPSQPSRLQPLVVAVGREVEHPDQRAPLSHDDLQAHRGQVCGWGGIVWCQVGGVGARETRAPAVWLRSAGRGRCAQVANLRGCSAAARLRLPPHPPADPSPSPPPPLTCFSSSIMVAHCQVEEM